MPQTPEQIAEETRKRIGQPILTTPTNVKDPPPKGDAAPTPAPKAAPATHDFVIKTTGGTFRIRAPKGTSPEQAMEMAAKANPKFAQIYYEHKSKTRLNQERDQQLQTQQSRDLFEKDVAVKAAQNFQKWRPRWDTPQQILQDPTWYGRSARYLGGELIGGAKAATGAAVGGWKLINDVATALNPFEEDVPGVPLSRVQQVGKDVAEAGKAVMDIGKDTWDLIRHFPEASADPEKFGQTIANDAMLVDGGIKFAEKAANRLKVNPAKATSTAHSASNGVPSRLFQRKAFEDAYVHNKGFEIARKVAKASKEIDAEIKTHSSGIASQIDQALPRGVIDAGQEATTIAQKFSKEIKTPDPMKPALSQMFQDAIATAPGQWTWEKARQFRSSIGRAMDNVVGPQKAVLTQVYKDLSVKLEATATKYGLGKEWKHYNELERKTSRQYGKLIRNITKAQSGKAVHGILAKDSGLTAELADNFTEYGLDRKDILKFVQDGTRIIRDQKGWRGSMIRMVYGSGPGFGAFAAARMAGAPWIGALAGGLLVGGASTHLINLVRALKLSPDVIEHMMGERKLPGKMAMGTGTFPGGAPPTTPKPKPKAGLPPSSAGPTPTPTPAPTTARATIEKKMLPQVTSATTTPVEKTAQAQLPAPKAEPSVTKVPEGVHGKGKIAGQAKARERVAKARGVAKRSKTAEATEAQARAQATNMDVSKLQIPEMEEALREMNPTSFSSLQKLRKAKSVPDEEYIEALKYLILEHYEKGQK